MAKKKIFTAGVVKKSSALKRVVARGAAKARVPAKSNLTHVDARGRAAMVDVGEKAVTARRAVAEARVMISPALAQHIRKNSLAKGNVLDVARLAGIQAAKRTDEMIPLCQAEGIAIIPWSPLARGFLTGNRVAAAQGDTLRSRSDDFAHRMYYQPDDFKVVAAVQAIASARGVPSAQIALAWLLAQPGVTAPIIGASKLAHLEDAVAALSLQLNAAELAALSEPYRPHPVLGIKA